MRPNDLVGICKQCGKRYTIYYDDDGYCEEHYSTEENDESIESFHAGGSYMQSNSNETWDQE